jgi:hypothetical protein
VQDASGVGNLYNVYLDKVKVKRICKGMRCKCADWISEFE